MSTKSYLVTAHSNQEEYNAGCDYCVVDFTPEFLAKLAAWKKAFQGVKESFPDVDLWRIGSTSATFVSAKAVKEFLEEDAYARIEEDSDQLPVALQNYDYLLATEKYDATTADEVCMGPTGFWFEAVPRHSDGLVVSSDYFPWAWFTKCSNCSKPRDEHANGKCLFDATKYASTTPRIGP
jgi:hypothetical protein